MIAGKDRGAAHHSQPVCASRGFRQSVSNFSSCGALKPSHVDELTRAELKMSAQARLVVNQSNVGPLFSDCQRRRNTGRAAAYDRYVGVVIPVLIRGLGNVIYVDPAQASYTANETASHAPEQLWPMQRFVVEAHRHEPCQGVQNRQEVPFQRRPSVLVTDMHTLLDRLNAGADVGDTVDIHQAVWAPPGAAEQSTGPMVFETSAESRDARCVKGRCDGVALISGHPLAVKLEFHHRSTVDQFTGSGCQSGTTTLFGHRLWPECLLDLVVGGVPQARNHLRQPKPVVPPLARYSCDVAAGIEVA